MNSHFSIKPQSLHLWRVRISDFISQEENLSALLSADENSRGDRFKFEIHRNRYLITRANLRKVLSLYTQTAPQQLTFAYGKHGKPYLANQSLQFNVSHSDDLAVFAITAEQAVGVDLEKMEEAFKDTVAKRFFNAKEYQHLCELPDVDKRTAFYSLWSKKEALIKLLGNGIYTSLNSFSVTADQSPEKVIYKQDQALTHYFVQGFYINSHYQAAFATPLPVAEIEYWDYLPNGPKQLTNFC